MDEKFIEVLYQAMGALGVKSKEEFEQGLLILGEDGISLVYQLYQQDPTNIEGIALVCAQIIQQKQLKLLAVVARMGAQLNYINQLRGTCPEGYEVERYMRGGCVKCKKSSDDPVSRFKKHREGDTLRQDSTLLSERIKKHIPKTNSKSAGRANKTIEEAMRTSKNVRNPLSKTKSKVEHEVEHSSKNTKVLKKGNKVRKCGEGNIASYRARVANKHNEYPPHVREFFENDSKRLGNSKIKDPNKLTGPNKQKYPDKNNLPHIQNLPHNINPNKPPKSPTKKLPAKINKDMPDNVIEYYRRRNKIKGLTK